MKWQNDADGYERFIGSLRLDIAWWPAAEDVWLKSTAESSADHAGAAHGGGGTEKAASSPSSTLNNRSIRLSRKLGVTRRTLDRRPDHRRAGR